jgi:hypothetical protein
MNIQNLVIEKVPAPSTDWKVFGDILDDDGNLIGTYGPDGTSVNEWWVTQDERFQYQTVQQFAVTMALEITNGDAE